MFRLSTGILFCFISFKFGFGDELTIIHSPPSVRFTSNKYELRSSDLVNLNMASLGYTPKSSPPPILAVTDAFNYPIGSVIVDVQTAGIPIKMEGISYNLVPDTSIQDVHGQISSLIGSRIQRPISFQSINAADLESKFQHDHKSNQVKEQIEDLEFQQEMNALLSLVDNVKNKSTSQSGGQDIIHVKVQKFAPLLKKYGPKSEKVKQTVKSMRSTLMNVFDDLRKFYDNQVIIQTVMSYEPDKAKVRRVRAATGAPVPFGEPTNSTENWNLYTLSSPDYPVVFNIVLLLSIILIATIIAVSVAMAFMDPDRDSIIYRMTNPRMKKEQ